MYLCIGIAVCVSAYDWISVCECVFGSGLSLSCFFRISPVFSWCAHFCVGNECALSYRVSFRGVTDFHRKRRLRCDMSAALDVPLIALKLFAQCFLAHLSFFIPCLADHHAWLTFSFLFAPHPPSSSQSLLALVPEASNVYGWFSTITLIHAFLCMDVSKCFLHFLYLYIY